MKYLTGLMLGGLIPLTYHFGFFTPLWWLATFFLCVTAAIIAVYQWADEQTEKGETK